MANIKLKFKACGVIEKIDRKYKKILIWTLLSDLSTTFMITDQIRFHLILLS